MNKGAGNAGWQRRRLGDVCRFIDYRGKTPEKTESGLRLITAKNVKMGFLQRHPVEFVNPNSYKGWMTRGIPRMGDVLFTTEAPLANVAQLDTDERVVFAQRIIALQPTEFNLDRTFLKYLLLSDAVQQRIHKEGTGATVNGIKASLLKRVEIAFPLLPEQQRIVDTLDEAFDGIATAKVNAEKNLQNARALFESHLQAVFTQRGERWVDAKLGDVCHKITDGTHITPTYTKAGVPFLSVKDLTKGFIDFSDTRFISVEEHQSLTKRWKPVRNDILYTKVGTTGVAQVVDVDEEFSIFVSVALLKVKHEVILNWYLEHFLNAPYAREQARRRTRGMANKNLVITDIKEIEVHFPRSLDQQRFIVAKLDTLAAETQHLESIYQQKLAALDALKKSLLHQAFTGAL